MEAVWIDPSRCPSCGSAYGAEYLVLSIDGAIELSFVYGQPIVEIAVSCMGCHHRRALLNTYRLKPWWSVLEQVRMLENVLEIETGLPVFIDPPDDPGAGVREPRRPSPSAGSLGAWLTPP